jgi:hypothetical protein
MRIPQIVIMQIMKETGLDFFNKDHWPDIWKILKKPEYAPFRTTQHDLG